MSILSFQATREDWLKQFGSENTQKAYVLGIKHWDDFLKSKNLTEADVLQELKEKNQDQESYLFLNQFVVWMNARGIKRASSKLYFTALRSWCAANGVLLFDEYVKRMVRFPKQDKEMRAALKMEDVKKLVFAANSKRMKAILLVLLSSGMRIGEVLRIRVIDIDSSQTPVRIKVRAANTKTREERIAYISDEAWEFVREIIKDRELDEFAFVKNADAKALWSFETMFGILRKGCGLVEKYDDGVHYLVNVHAFRAFFLTQATKILGEATAHAMIGHHKYLDQYFRLEESERRELYKKVEPYITISDEYRQKMIIAEKDRQIEEMSQMKEEIIKLKAYQKRQEKRARNTA